MELFGALVTIDSPDSLKGWKYPIYTDLLDMPVVDALIKAGVTRELLKQNDPNKMQLFDFLRPLGPHYLITLSAKITFLSKS